MAEPIIYLTPEDREAIQAVIDRVLPSVNNPRLRRPPPPLSDAAPECYLARTPSTGIPPAVYYGTGTSETFGLGTGTGSVDIMGCAECEIYAIYYVDGAYKIYRQAPALSLVFNYTQASIYDRYVPVIRDKPGRWMVSYVTIAGVGKAAGTIDYRNFGPITPWDGRLGKEASRGSTVQMFNLGPQVTSGDWVTYSLIQGDLAFMKQCS